MTTHSLNDNRICIFWFWCREKNTDFSEKKNHLVDMLKYWPTSYSKKYILKQELWFFGELNKVSKLHPRSTEEFEGKFISCYFSLKVILLLSVDKIIQQTWFTCLDDQLYSEINSCDASKLLEIVYLKKACDLP